TSIYTLRAPRSVSVPLVDHHSIRRPGSPAPELTSSLLYRTSRPPLKATLFPSPTLYRPPPPRRLRSLRRRPSRLLPIRPLWRRRSEEHTSELQSLTNFACRLLL